MKKFPNDLDKYLKELVLEKIYPFIKSNPTLLLLSLTTLGGVLQFFELYLISPSYIRFFSVSQLIPDGLFVTIAIIIFIFILYVSLNFSWVISSFFLLDVRKKKSLVKIIKFRKLSEKPLFLIIINVIVIGTFVFLFKYDFIPFKPASINISAIVLLMTVSFYFTTISKDIFKKFCGLYFVWGFLMLIQVFYTSLIDFNSTNVIPYNNVNFKVLRKKIESKYPYAWCKIIYYNDNYIFVSITQKNPQKNKRNGKLSSDIEIYKLDEIISKP